MSESKQHLRTKRELANALKHLLQHQSFESITTNHICDQALVHRSTFYRYFHDKYELLGYVVQLISYEICQHALMDNETNQALIKGMVHYIDENQKLFRNVAINNRNNDIYSDLIRMASKIFFDNAQRMNDPISQKICSAQNPILMCNFYSGGIIEVLKRWVNDDYKISKEELIAALIQIMH